jgi:hypothetical protein
MLDYIKRIEDVINSGVLLQGFPRIPDVGASDEMIKAEETKLNRSLSDYHKQFLKQWNGANLDFIRVYGVHKTESEFIKELGTEYAEWIDDVISEIEGNSILFADDAGGNMYFELEDGRIAYIDSEFSGLNVIAVDMRDFFLDFLFGDRADQYLGDAWKQELKQNGII